MSSFGLFLLLFAALLVLVSVIRFFAWLTELQEEHGSLPRAGVHAIQRYVLVRPVNCYSPDHGTDAWYVGDDHMSSSAESPVRTTAEPAEPIVVRGDAHQPEPVEPPENELVREPASLRRLPKHDLIVLLAVQRDDDGKYLYSANEITNFIGGTAAPIKALIAEVRNEQPAEQVVRLNHLPRPIGGWHKA